MLVRWKKWRQSTTGIKIADPRQDCFFSPENGGIVDVRHKQVIDRLLAHQNEFEPVWENIGVFFDASGKQIDPEPEIGTVTEQGKVVYSDPGEPPTKVSGGTTLTEAPKRGRPKGKK